MDKNLFKGTYMNVMRVLVAGKPIFVKITDTQELMIKKDPLNAQTFVADWIIHGEPKFRKKMTYIELYNHLTTLDPFNFRTIYKTDNNVIKVDFINKRIV